MNVLVGILRGEKLFQASIHTAPYQTKWDRTLTWKPELNCDLKHILGISCYTQRSSWKHSSWQLYILKEDLVFYFVLWIIILYLPV